MQPDVSVILVSYNTEALTKDCLNSLYEKTQDVNFDVWVIDNNSKDNTCEMIKKEFPQVKLIENKENKGFGVANNQALRETKSKYVFLWFTIVFFLPKIFLRQCWMTMLLSLLFLLFPMH